MKSGIVSKHNVWTNSLQITAILRVIGAIAAAVAVAFGLLIAVEFFSSVVYPPPTGFTGTQEEMCEHVARYPHWVLATVVPMWGAIAFISTWLAGWLGNRGCAIFIASLLLAATAFNIAMLPYTPWFKVVQPMVIAVAVLLGYRFSIRPRTVATI
jgi:hypothetical protein